MESNPLHNQGKPAKTVQHSKERALNERQFELLLEGASDLAETCYYYEYDPELAIYALGRLGLRRSELAHLRESWINWRDKMIIIPSHEPCDNGSNGGPCGMCRQAAKQRADHADELSFEEALQYVWAPKTDAGAREVYFGYDVRAEMYLERYFASEDYNKFEASGTAVSRRVKRSANLAPELNEDEIHPHALRATAATYHAGRGLELLQLMQYFGWKQASTAQVYIGRNGMNTARSLNAIHSQ